jgi:hypothetical protein
VALIRKSSALRDLFRTWIAVGVPATIGFVAYFLSRMRPWNTLFDALGVGLFWALVTTSIFGTLGYGLVRAVRTEGPTALDRALLGEDRTEATRWLQGAIVLSSATLIGLLALDREMVAREQAAPVGVGLELTVGIPAVFALIGLLHAYRNRGLLVSWAIIFAPTTAFWIAAFALPASPDLFGQTATILYAGMIALGPAAALGSVSYFLAVGIRAIVDRKRPPTSRNIIG